MPGLGIYITIFFSEDFRKSLKLIDNANVTKNVVDKIIYVKDYTRIQMIQSFIFGYFNERELYKGVGLDEIIAYGTTFQRCIISSEVDHITSKLILLDSIPRPQIFEIIGGVMIKLIN